MEEKWYKSETSPITVNISFDDFLYGVMRDFCDDNDIKIEIFIKKLIVLYLSSADMFNVIQ